MPSSMLIRRIERAPAIIAALGSFSFKLVIRKLRVNRTMPNTHAA
jgi:hypothetical protein